MRQVALNYRTGRVELQEVNVPALKPGGVLVQSAYSVISMGTEGMKVRQGKMSYIGKARARPDQVRKAWHTLQRQGPVTTYRKVMHRLDSFTQLGYSLSGVVISVGEGAEEFAVGQRVACAGGGYANHAEVNFVPKNLVVPVPNDVSMKHAAFVTLGAIAVQGLRQAEMQLGEMACVIGLGLLGQTLVQILRAAGIHVVGVDLLESRCKLAKELGAALATQPNDPSLLPSTRRLTAGIGVDCVFITAAGDSNEPLELAVRIGRDRARVVDIGRVKLNLPWKECYDKELDIRFSRSYGPGRYDPSYEEQGVDYPIGYVRWTECRNMSCFLDLVSSGKVRLDPIISAVRPFAEVDRVYEQIADGADHLLSVVIQYPELVALDRRLPNVALTPRPTARLEGKIRLGVVGAGNYASSVLLPILSKCADVHLKELATTRGLSAANAAKNFAFEQTTTDYKALLSVPDIDAVIIATRHASHARIAAEGLRAGKAVFVEKPLAINLSDVELVRQAIAETGNDRLLVGFNRRFSPLVREVAEFFRAAKVPLVLHYRVHAGQMEPSSWYLDTSEGSRFVGEAGHFFDVFSFITRSRPTSVVAVCLRPYKVTQDDLENVAVIVSYEDGSIGNLLYLTQGGATVPKEYLEVFGAGRTVQLQNFQSLTVFEGNRRTRFRGGIVDKGHKEEMHAFVSAVKLGLKMPVSVDSLLDTTLTTLAAVESLKTGQPVCLGDLWMRET